MSTFLSDLAVDDNMKQVINDLINNGIHFQYKYIHEKSYLYVSHVTGIGFCLENGLILHALTVVDSQPMAMFKSTI